MDNVPLKEYFESRFKTLENSINELKNNHFEHLEKKVDRIFWFLLTTLVALVTHAVGVILRG